MDWAAIWSIPGVLQNGHLGVKKPPSLDAQITRRLLYLLSYEGKRGLIRR